MASLKIFTIVTLLLAAARISDAQAQGLSSTDPSVSDGACNFPDVALWDQNVLGLFSPIRRLYVPRASASFYRTEYELKNGGVPAASPEILAAMRPRAYPFSLQATIRTGDLKVYFDSDPDVWFAYRCLPSSFSLPLVLSPPTTNLTCNYVGGSQGVAPLGAIDNPVYLSVMWSDPSAMILWGCFNGEQNWHILAVDTELTQAQREATATVLAAHGFDMSHAMDMSYN